jgi:hypothetical protein
VDVALGSGLAMPSGAVIMNCLMLMNLLGPPERMPADAAKGEVAEAVGRGAIWTCEPTGLATAPALPGITGFWAGGAGAAAVGGCAGA